MGDISDMMLDGTLCQGCGEYIGDGEGFPMFCASCAEDQEEMGNEIVDTGLGGYQTTGNKLKKKVSCDICGKKVKEIGLEDHRRDVHGLTTPRTL